MDMKKRMGAVAVLAGVMFGTAAGAAPVAPGNTSKEAQATPTETLTLKPGEVKDVSGKGAVRVAVGDPEIVDVSPEQSGAEFVFRLKGGKEGQTTLMVWSKDGTTRTYALIVQR